MSTSLYARFASVPYGDPTSEAVLTAAGWRPLRAIDKARAWHKGNEIVVSFRGTVPLDTEDLACDAALAAGTEEAQPRFVYARRWLLSLMHRYRRCRFTLASHSLGGSVNLYCMFSTHAHTAHTFNAFASSTMIANSVVHASALANYTRCTVHIVYEDPIGMTGTFLVGPTFQHIHVKDGLDVHSLSNWAED